MFYLMGPPHQRAHIVIDVCRDILAINITKWNDSDDDFNQLVLNTPINAIY
jgi:hypothetical protein